MRQARLQLALRRRPRHIRAMSSERPVLQSALGAGALLAGALIVGCTPTVRLEAPQEPIVINLNVKVEQEVRVKIDNELDQAFQRNPDLF